MELFAEVIPLEDLKVDTWYVGRGRNGIRANLSY